MRTNIEIDDALMKKMLKTSGAPSKKAAVEEAMRFYLRIKAQKDILKLRGKIKFSEGYDPKAMTKDKWAEAERRWQEDQKAKAGRAETRAA